MVDASKCEGTNREGGPCSATPQTGKAWCVWHDPSLVDQRRQWNQDAGRAKSNRARAKKRLLTSGMTLDEVDGALGVAIRGVLTGNLSPGIGTAVATLAKAVVAVRTAHDLETRLEALERAAGIREERYR